MPKTHVVFYKELNGSVPVIEWLDSLPKAVKIKCVFRIERLEGLGYELQRPECDFLEKGIYELRIRRGHINYRILYGFVGRQVALLMHGCTKESRVAAIDIERAKARLDRCKANFAAHKYEGKVK